MMRMHFSPARTPWRLSMVAAAVAAAVAVQWWGGSGDRSARADTTVTPDTHGAAMAQFQMARDLYEQGKYKDADAVNDKALQLDPTMSDAQILHKILQSKLAEAPTAGGNGKPEGPAKAANGFKLLNQQQISMIRLQELSKDDRSVRGKVPPKTLETFWNVYVKAQVGSDLSTTAYNNFTNPLNFVEQVRQIKLANMPELAQTIEITSDPVDMIPFRNSIHPWVLQNCATAACHGGEKGGKFRLYRPPGPVNDAAIYTNFYILSTYQPADGGKLLDRDQADKSNLLQYALPKITAAHAHPGTLDVHKFGGSNNPEYQNIVNWIKGLAYPQPEYGIVYELPGSNSTTKPDVSATRPAPHGSPPH